MEIEQEFVVDEGQAAVVDTQTADPVVETTTEEAPKVEKVEDPIPKGVQKRIDRAVRQKYEAEARSKMLEERVASMEQRQYAQQPQQRVLDNSEPKIENFDNFDQYVAAKAEYIAKKQIESTLTARERAQAEHREATERTKTVDSWNKRIAAATAEMPDFEEVLASSDVPMTPPMRQAIMESDIGPKLAYYLANNPEEAEKIAGMSPIGAIRTLGRIEERLSNSKPAVKSTDAPPPIKASGSTATVTKDPHKMSDAEFAAWRKNQIKARA
jgi:hypothetical protein